MNKVICTILVVMLAAGSAVAAGGLNSNGTVEVTLLESRDDFISLNYAVGEFEQVEIAIDGDVYALVTLAGESRIWEWGVPDLPRICRSVIIPDDGRMQARVTASGYRDIEGVRIAPSKGHLPRSVDPEGVPYAFGDVYQEDAWYPADIVKLRQPYILRDFRGQVVEVYPFQYNPAQQVLRVYTDLSIEVEKVAPGGENLLERSQPIEVFDREFKRIYQRHFINFRALDYTPVEEDGSMLIVTYDPFRDAIMPLADWKNQKGIPTSVVNVSTLGNDAAQIKSYIVHHYNSLGLTYVLLIGDAAQVATPMSSGWWPASMDPSYGQILGGDSYPELFVGRFSAEDISQLNTQVERTLQYEMEPQVGAEWYHKGTGMASNQGTGTLRRIRR